MLASAIAQAFVLAPSGELRAVVNIDEAVGTPDLPAGLSIADLATRISGSAADPGRWAQHLARLRVRPDAAVRFDVIVDPTGNATAPLRRDVVLTPVCDGAGQLDAIVAHVSLGRPLESADPLELSPAELLAETAPALLWSSLPDGSLDYLSAEWERFTGTPVRQILAQGYYGLIHPEDLRDITEVEITYDERDRFVLPPFRLRHHSGAYRWVDTVVCAVRDARGEVIRTVGVATDAEARRHADVAERAVAKQLASALELSGLGRFEVNLETGACALDPRAREVLGVEPSIPNDEVTFGGLMERLHPDDVAPLEEAIGRVTAGLDTHYRNRSRLVLPGPSGPVIRTVHGVGRLQIGDDLIPRLVGVVDDITAESEESAARLRTQKRDALATLASGIAHDFNNAIGAITLGADTIETELAHGGDADEGLSEIRQAADRAARLVRRLVSLSQDADPEVLPVDLTSLVAAVCDALAPELPPGVQIAAPSTSAGVRRACGSAHDLRQVLESMLDNAVEAVAPQGGRIEIRLDDVTVHANAAVELGGVGNLEPGHYVRVTIVDDGPGIAPGDLGRVFDPFFTTRRPGGGTGLGLTTALSIVRGHGGAITVSNRLDASGAQVSILLPAAED